MSFVDIRCPKHGQLYSNVVFAEFKTDKMEQISISCYFCFKCKCFYTLSPDIKYLHKPTVRGLPLIMGIAPYESKESKSEILGTPTKRSVTIMEEDYDEIPLGEKSILGKCGYSTQLVEAERHWVLEGCVDKHGKKAVINALRRNISLRERQKKDYSYAIGIWLQDIEYVKTLDDHVFQEWLASELEKQRQEREKYFKEQNTFWWENKN